MIHYEIAGEKWPIVFNLNTIRKFMHAAGLKKISEFDKLMSDVELDDMTISVIENKIEFIKCAIDEGLRIEGVKSDGLSVDDLFAEMSKNPSMLTDIIQEFIDSQPPADEETEGKKKAIQTP